MTNHHIIRVDQTFINDAARLLNDVWEEVCGNDKTYANCSISSCIDLVLRKKPTRTWPYILMTQLLGKATRSEVNILSMHASSELDGAWDARSLCEHVISKEGCFESIALEGILGSVKQPYNNSPGQKPALSKSNKTAPGHIAIRDSVIDSLTTVSDAATARNCLGYFLRVCRTLILEERSTDSWIPELSNKRIAGTRVRKLLFSLARAGRDGEGLAVAVAATLSIALPEKENYDVQLHRTNSSRGQSGRQNDLEVYLGPDRYAAFELKDKPFSAPEVESSAMDALASGFNRFAFIYGYGAGAASPSIPSDSFEDMCREQNLLATCIPFEAFVDSLLLCANDIDLDELRASIVRILEEARIKVPTQTIARQLLREFLSDAVL